MAKNNFLNKTVLAYFYNRLKTVFSTKTELNALDTKVDEIIAEGGEPNVIEVVQKNGTALPISNKTVNVEVPTATSDLTNDGDGTSNFATQDYVAENGGKIDVIQVNTVPQTITNKTVNISVPTITHESGEPFIVGTSDNLDSIAFDIDTANASVEVINGSGSSVFLSNNLSNLTNDAGFQTQEDVQALIDSELADITGIDFQVVQTLPASGVKGTIYLLHNQTSETDIYDEYIWLTPTGGTAHWEQIGTTAVDLSDYWSQTDLVAITTAEIDEIIGA